MLLFAVLFIVPMVVGTAFTGVEEESKRPAEDKVETETESDAETNEEINDEVR